MLERRFDCCILLPFISEIWRHRLAAIVLSLRPGRSHGGQDVEAERDFSLISGSSAGFATPGLRWRTTGARHISHQASQEAAVPGAARGLAGRERWRLAR